jgi:hypothetical protein
MFEAVKAVTRDFASKPPIIPLFQSLLGLFRNIISMAEENPLQGGFSGGRDGFKPNLCFNPFQGITKHSPRGMQACRPRSTPPLDRASLELYAPVIR